MLLQDKLFKNLKSVSQTTCTVSASKGKLLKIYLRGQLQKESYNSLQSCCLMTCSISFGAESRRHCRLFSGLIANVFVGFSFSQNIRGKIFKILDLLIFATHSLTLHLALKEACSVVFGTLLLNLHLNIMNTSTTRFAFINFLA